MGENSASKMRPIPMLAAAISICALFSTTVVAATTDTIGKENQEIGFTDMWGGDTSKPTKPGKPGTRGR